MTRSAASEGLLKIGDVATALGATHATLRFYEQQGLLTARRTQGGTRLYSPGDVNRLRAVLRLVELGLPLLDIQKLALARTACATGAQSSHEVTPLLEELEAQVQRKQAALAALAEELRFVRGIVAQCGTCGHPPTRRGCPECPANHNLNRSDLLNLIWEQE